jgi:hypothetical protein
MILTRIIETKRIEIEEAKRARPLAELKKETGKIPLVSSFRKNISRPHHVNLIAEIKKASPSKGVISDIPGQRRPGHISTYGREVLPGPSRAYKDRQGVFVPSGIAERFYNRRISDI